MSLGEEMMAESWIAYQMAILRITREADNGIWTTRDGRQIHVEDMTTSHLINTIKFLQRNNGNDIAYPWIHRMQTELRKRGEQDETN